MTVLFAVLIMALANSADGLGRFLAGAVPVYFGEVSYSTYMIHDPVWVCVKAVFKHYSLPLPTPWPTLCGIPAALLLSIFTFHFVELPAREAIRGKGQIIEIQSG
jgi:peptidoglycan/LPS O-acetylase OafA/YrhL